jgi:ATP-dependent DNA ligase
MNKLYKTTKTGATQEWEISVRHVDGDWTLITRFGQVGGAIQETTDVIKSGKNLGKANETTVEQQAYNEALARWEKQVKKGYTENIGEETKLGGVSPMLAQSWDKHHSKIKFPAYIQPKLDGTRCLAIIDENQSVTLWSRTRKPITSSPHIIKELSKKVKGPVVLDGELYNHSYKDKFEELISLIRQTTPADNHTDIQYHVYDVVTDEPFALRNERVGNLIKDFGYVKRVETVLVNYIDDRFLDEGYEGTIVRNSSGLYDIGHRSFDLQKVKVFEDAEFEIVGVKEGRGKLAGHGIFTLKCPAGEFDAKLDGKLDNLKDIWENKDKYIGKLLTVKYQGLTAYGIPRFPVGKGIRDYE